MTMLRVEAWSVGKVGAESTLGALSPFRNGTDYDRN
jgi:hypothetical protein